MTFYSFPKDHWTHLRTTNPVESPFSAVRLRTDAAKRFKKVTPRRSFGRFFSWPRRSSAVSIHPNCWRRFIRERSSLTESRSFAGGAPPDLVYTPIDVTSDHDIDYAYESGVASKAASVFEDVFHPVEPIQVRGDIMARF